jgi:hypothetical protein
LCDPFRVERYWGGRLHGFHPWLLEWFPFGELSPENPQSRRPPSHRFEDFWEDQAV